MSRPRIVITGLGGLCSLGTDTAAIWNAMQAGRGGIGPLETVPLHDLKIRTGGEIKQLPAHDIDRKRLVTMDRFSLLAVLAAGQALAQAGLRVEHESSDRIGAVVGKKTPA